MGLPFANRDAFLIRSKPAFTDWLHSLTKDDPDAPETWSLASEPILYLVDELEMDIPEAGKAQLKKCWREIAESEFEAWWTVDSDWPKLRTLADFEKYFTWEYISMIHDTSDSEIEFE